MRIKLFSYLTIDYKAAEAMLNGMAAKGWALKRLFLGIFAVFQRTERTDLRYFVDFGDSVYREAPEYLTLCADAGWVNAGYTRSMNLYASAPGTQPVPLQTDSTLEYERFRKLVLKRVRTSATVYLVMGVILLLFLLGGVGSFGATLFYFYLFCFLFFSAPALLVCGGTYIGLLLSRVRQWRQLTEAGEPIPAPPPHALGRGILTLLGGVYTVVFEFTYILDLMVNQKINGRLGVLFLLITIPAVALTLFVIRKLYPQRRTSAAFSWLILLGMSFLLVLNLFFPTAHLFQPAPELPIAPLTDADVQVSSHGSFVGRRDVWREHRSDEMPFGISVEVHTLRFDWLADSVQDSFSAMGMEPLTGREGFWQADLGRNPLYGLINIPTSSDRFFDAYHTLLYRQGNSLLLIEYPKEMPLDDLLALVDAWQ